MQYTKEQLSGSYFTTDLNIQNLLMNEIGLDNNIFNLKILEPSVGVGDLIKKLVQEMYKLDNSSKKMEHFLTNNLYMSDINEEYLLETKQNLNNVFKDLYGKELSVNLNLYKLDLTLKIKNYLNELSPHLESFDIVFGNPPFVTMYGRRDKKYSEKQRMKIISEFDQFPVELKNGKINYSMLFIENGIDLLNNKGKLVYILDNTFFENSFIHTRKYLLENIFINRINLGLSSFSNVYSSQLILNLDKYKNNKLTTIKNFESGKSTSLKQETWLNSENNFKFNYFENPKDEEIVNKVLSKKLKSISEIYPNKFIRTSSMLLTYEDKFTKPINSDFDDNYYPYYEGSKSLKDKFGDLHYSKVFNYDKKLQNNINDELKKELTKKGIKNKKRIGLGEKLVHQNPKIYLRQSSSELIATYTKQVSTANNSLYSISFRDNNSKNNKELLFICGYLNSDLISFYALTKNIIRTAKTKQPQMNISDLIKIPIIEDSRIKNELALVVAELYKNKTNTKFYLDKLNNFIYDYFNISNSERVYISSYLKVD